MTTNLLDQPSTKSNPHRTADDQIRNSHFGLFHSSLELHDRDGPTAVCIDVSEQLDRDKQHRDPYGTHDRLPQRTFEHHRRTFRTFSGVDTSLNVAEAPTLCPGLMNIAGGGVWVMGRADAEPARAGARERGEAAADMATFRAGASIGDADAEIATAGAGDVAGAGAGTVGAACNIDKTGHVGHTHAHITVTSAA